MNAKTARRIKAVTITVSPVLVAASLAFPAFTIRDYDGPRTNNGLELFFMGGFAILGGGFMEWIVWLANPLYVAGLVLLIRSAPLSKRFALWAAMLALSFAVWRNVLAAESGRTAAIVSRHTGYWLWTAGMFALAIGSWNLFDKRVDAKSRKGSDAEGPGLN